MPNAEVTALMAVLTTVLAFGVAGKHVAQKRGFSPVLGMLVGGIFPLVGVGLLMLWKHRNERVGGS